jgi:hypothetical protein
MSVRQQATRLRHRAQWRDQTLFAPHVRIVHANGQSLPVGVRKTTRPSPSGDFAAQLPLPTTAAACTVECEDGGRRIVVRTERSNQPPDEAPPAIGRLRA